jgi:benzoyl-CoA reductase/2-hydroxyglutaryl-CoA dehydratase subunit BcrC/BadD/HgdB
MEELSSKARSLYSEELSSLIDLPKSGIKTAAYACGAFPPAIVAGMGLRPVRLPLGVSRGQPGIGNGIVREDVCPLVRELILDIQSGNVDTVIGMHTCDTTRRLFQESGRFSSLPVHQLQLPATSGSVSQDFFASQIDRLCRDMVLNGFSRGYDAAAAEEWQEATMDAASLVRERMHTIPPVALQYILHLFRIADPSGLKAKIGNLLNRSAVYHPKFTFLLSGSPVPPGDDTVAEITESLGGSLIPVNCTGFQMFPDGAPDDYSPRALAKQYFNSMKCVRCRPNTQTFSYLEQQAAQTGADGLVYKCLKFCDLWFTEKVRIKEKMSIPVLVLDTGFSEGESERTGVRLESFVQSLEMKFNE